MTNSIYCQNKTESTIQSTSNLNHDKQFDDLDVKIVILGRIYDKLQENINELILKDIQSRYWFTYRKGFNNINATGPDSDSGWGCMLRCGQMLLAECFLRIHLGRDFKYDSLNNGNPYYWKILNYFKDEKLASYSVQQIATMGISEGIQIGKWFGPNTIIQVLSKLSTYDDTNHLKFYIAMDNCIFIDEICTYS